MNRIGYEAVRFGADEPDELATVQVLVAGGAELGRQSVAEGLTPLARARERGYRTLERVLTAAEDHRPSADPDAALLAAAPSGDADALALALRHGAALDGFEEIAGLLRAAG